VKTLVVLGVLAVIGAGTVVLVQQNGGWTTLTGKAWSITYEITAQPAETLADVTYLESPDRYRKEAPRPTDLTTPLPWQYEAVINAGEKAQVSATPKGDQVLTCRVLLDGLKVLASATAAPGQRVNCETITRT
jgi:hypothetical protein